jgi:hypothetical protein
MLVGGPRQMVPMQMPQLSRTVRFLLKRSRREGGFAFRGTILLELECSAIDVREDSIIESLGRGKVKPVDCRL